MIPPVLTCLIGRHLGPVTTPSQVDHFELRDLAASLLKHLCTRYSKVSSNLRSRLARTLLKTYLDPKRPLGSHYGAILGLGAIGEGSSSNEVVRMLVLPNLKAYGEVLKGPMEASEGEVKILEADRVMGAIVRMLKLMSDEDTPMMNGVLTNGVPDSSQSKDRLIEVVGDVIGSKIMEIGDEELVKDIIKNAES